MIQYLIILLDDTSVSFYHYTSRQDERNLMPLETLKSGILYGMKENQNIQFVYPNYDLPDEYKQMINMIDHTDIKPMSVSEGADVIVADSCLSLLDNIDINSDTFVVRTDRKDLFANYSSLGDSMAKMQRLNIVLTDIERFTKDDFTK